MSEAIKPNAHHFFVDGAEYSTDKPTLTGLEIKTIANVPGNYQLFLEEKGDAPDRAISDGESIVIGHKDHFFAVPPATFG